MGEPHETKLYFNRQRIAKFRSHEPNVMINIILEPADCKDQDDYN